MIETWYRLPLRKLRGGMKAAGYSIEHSNDASKDTCLRLLVNLSLNSKVDSHVYSSVGSELRAGISAHVEEVGWVRAVGGTAVIEGHLPLNYKGGIALYQKTTAEEERDKLAAWKRLRAPGVYQVTNYTGPESENGYASRNRECPHRSVLHVATSITAETPAQFKVTMNWYIEHPYHQEEAAFIGPNGEKINVLSFFEEACSGAGKGKRSFLEPMQLLCLESLTLPSAAGPPTLAPTLAPTVEG